VFCLSKKLREQIFCLDVLERLLEELDLLGKLMTSDETLVFHYIPGTKFPSCQWKRPDSKIDKRVNIKIKGQNRADLLFFIRGIIHYKYVTLKAAVNHAFFLKFQNIHGYAFIENDKILGWQSEFCII
jgi:hypothetical protein